MKKNKMKYLVAIDILKLFHEVLRSHDHTITALKTIVQKIRKVIKKSNI